MNRKLGMTDNPPRHFVEEASIAPVGNRATVRLLSSPWTILCIE